MAFLLVFQEVVDVLGIAVNCPDRKTAVDGGSFPLRAQARAGCENSLKPLHAGISTRWPNKCRNPAEPQSPLLGVVDESALTKTVTALTWGYVENNFSGLMPLPGRRVL